MRWIIRENEEGLCPGLTLCDIPPKLPAKLKILHRGQDFLALAENIAGVIPFENGHQLYISPKYADIDPVELLFYINDSNILIESISAEQYAVGAGEIRADILAQLFAAELLKIQNKPLKFSRILTPIESVAIRGHVNWIKTECVQHSGAPEKVISKDSIPTKAIPENIIISLAAKKVLQHFKRLSPQWNVLYRWSCIPIPQKDPSSFLVKIQRQMRKKQYSGAHAYYYNAIVLAQAILGFSGILGGYDFSDNAMVFNMPSLYEDFVRTAFQRISATLCVSCQKGFTPRSFLFNGGNCEVIPDIAIYRGEQIIALMDVKYKAPDSKDFYQLYAYMKYSGLNRAYIISPSVIDETRVVAFDGGQINFIQISSSKSESVEKQARKILETVI